ncbi:energy-coupling factor transporter transmembrane protein EcfT|uniref:Energy-coupling factor transport system permease protein n=1 Tax=Dendrosporobacter quercicolus TaxID=146817 RepID=A0A1G9QY44_9FIRM|nr:energy-coupling factor transporter transmembrane component T [Dendrosporobacter quercicolus]NSL48399.1 energy-coupling factor transporter transmembrane protein EcfT [Dendrosporobacter quercicolus DSM 1736]SDM15517.1 energy-coupling factor transport system permease protein [Dendrosporobacter quercicolus]
MYNKQIWRTESGRTLIYALDARTKLAVMLTMAVLAILIDSAATLFILLILTLLLHFWAQMPAAKWRLLSLLILFGIWGSMASQALFYNQEPRTVVACLLPAGIPVFGQLSGGLYIYREGLEHGAVQALRTSIMSALGLLVCWTTNTNQLLKGFLAWRMPYELAFMLITGLRFLPVIAEETATVLTAQRLRGFEPLKTLSVRHFLQSAMQTLFPILARTVRRAATLALSVQSRGFGRGSPCLADAAWPVRQKIAVYFLLAGTVAAMIAKLMYLLQYNGLLYVAGWRVLYDVMKVWL